MVEGVTDVRIDTPVAGVVEIVTTGDAEAVDDPVLVAANESAVDGVFVDKREVVDDRVLVAAGESVVDDGVVDRTELVRVVGVVGELDRVLG